MKVGTDEPRDRKFGIGTARMRHEAVLATPSLAIVYSHGVQALAFGKVGASTSRTNYEY